MKIYFAGSIRGGRDDKDLYKEIVQILSQYGLVLTEHIAAKNLTEAGDNMENKDIHQRDTAWLESADVVVAEVTTPSLGVGYEIAKAENMNKQVLCIYRPNGLKRLSAMIGGSPNVMIKEYENTEDLRNIFNSFFRAD